MDKRSLGVGEDTGIKPRDPDASSNLVLTTKNNKVMLKSKNEIENYEEKAKSLQENGWETWYNDDNWIKTEWIEQGKSVDRMGDSTDRIYAWLMKSEKRVKQGSSAG